MYSTMICWKRKKDSILRAGVSPHFNPTTRRNFFWESHSFNQTFTTRKIRPILADFEIRNNASRRILN